MTFNDSSVNDVPTIAEEIAFLLSEFTTRLQRGESLGIDDFAAQHAKYADDLRRLLPTARALANLAISRESTAEPQLETLGDFRLLREVGRGGMGIVYQATQISLNRSVALKVLPFAAVLDPNQLRRFHNEAQAAAGLHHANIVPVYSVGCERGVHYYAMQFIDGFTLDQFIAAMRDSHERSFPASSSNHDQGEKQRHEALPNEVTTLSARASEEDLERGDLGIGSRERRSRTQVNLTRELPETLPIGAFHTHDRSGARVMFRKIAEFGAQAAAALDYAHQQGVVHRDIKPANLLIDFQGKVWITDFGLARIGTDAKLTMTGDLIGTLRYMSPEQLLTQRPFLDHKTDIYSLGVTLYELLTLQPAFPDSDRRLLFQKIPEGVARTPRSLRAEIPLDLETIVLKAIDTNPERRYQTAAELESDLRRYLKDEPIRAKRPTLSQVAAKWSQRHKTVVSLGIVFLLLTVIGLTVGTVLIARERRIAEEAATMALIQQGTAEQQRDVARYNLYVADMQLAHQAWTTGRVARMQELLQAHIPQPGEIDLRGWEWRYLTSLSRPAASTIDAKAGEITTISWSADGRLLAIGGHAVKLWDVVNQKLVMTLRGATTRIPRVTSFGCNIAWRPKSYELVCAAPDNSVKIWNAQTGQELAKYGPFESPPQKLCCSPDGQTLAIMCNAGTINIFAWTPESKPIVLKGKVLDGRSFAWSPDGALLAVGGNSGGNVEIWDTAEWRVLKLFQAHSHDIYGLAWSPDNHFLATGSTDQHLKIWNTNDWTLAIDRRAQTELNEIAWSPDGKLLVVSCDDSIVQIWDARTWSSVNVVRGHTDRVKSVAWAPTDPQLASAGTDGTIRIWDPLRFQDAQDINGSRPAAWSPDGEKLIGNGNDRGVARTFDSKSGQVVGEFHYDGLKYFATLAWNPTRNIIAGGTYGEHLILFDAESGQELWRKIPCATRSVAWNNDGTLLASAGNENAIQIWEPESGECLQTLLGHTAPLGSVIWSPDAKRLASKDWDQNVKIWDAATWREIMHLRCHQKDCFGADNGHSVAWSPDGRELAAGTSEGWILIWNSMTGAERFSIKGHATSIRAISWSPDGNRLASSGRDRRIRIWDAHTGRGLLDLEGHPTSVDNISWSPDGRKLLSGCPMDILPMRIEPCIRIWDATRGYE